MDSGGGAYSLNDSPRSLPRNRIVASQSRHYLSLGITVWNVLNKLNTRVKKTPQGSRHEGEFDPNPPNSPEIVALWRDIRSHNYLRLAIHRCPIVVPSEQLLDVGVKHDTTVRIGENPLVLVRGNNAKGLGRPCGATRRGIAVLVEISGLNRLLACLLFEGLLGLLSHCKARSIKPEALRKLIAPSRGQLRRMSGILRPAPSVASPLDVRGIPA
jgi:hypothetical protein